MDPRSSPVPIAHASPASGSSPFNPEPLCVCVRAPIDVGVGAMVLLLLSFVGLRVLGLGLGGSGWILHPVAMRMFLEELA